jgi:glycosyltransferase involved in cell wall biosynthesis
MKKTILYLRTDLLYDELVAGGSVGHTLGVIQGFLDLDYEVVCIATSMQNLIQKLKIKKMYSLSKPPLLKLLRWRISTFVQSFRVFWQGYTILKQQSIAAMYQRYTILNCSGVLLRWWFGKKLILEYNGSEVWVDKHWSSSKGFLKLTWLVAFIEKLNLSQADFVVVVSEALKIELMKRGVQENKILVNPNGVNPDFFVPVSYQNKEAVCESQL